MDSHAGGIKRFRCHNNEKIYLSTQDTYSTTGFFSEIFFFLFRNFYSEIFHSVESYHRNTPPSMSTCILSFLDLGFLNAVIEYSTPYFVSYINLLAHKELVFFHVVQYCTAWMHNNICFPQLGKLYSLLHFDVKDHIWVSFYKGMGI